MTNTIIALRVLAAIPGLLVLSYLFFDMCKKFSVRCYGRLEYSDQYCAVMQGRNIEEKLRTTDNTKLWEFRKEQSALYTKYDLYSKEDNE